MSTIKAASPQAIIFGLSGQTKAVFFRQLSTMINSGLPVGRAVKTSSEIGMQKLGSEIARQVDHGSKLSEAMARYPYHFTAHEIALVKAGEVSGQLDRQLNELATSAELDWQLSRNISSKLVYPVIVAHSVVLLPPLFLLVKDGIQAYLSAVLGILLPVYLVVATFALTYRMFRQHGGPRRVIDGIISSLPIIGAPAKYGARIRFLHTLSNLVDAGFLPSQAVPLAAEACNNYWLRDRVMSAWNAAGREVAISEVMRQSAGFSSFELGLVLSGEEAGSFAQSLKKASESLRPEYEAQVHRLTVMLPIFLLFVVGGLVGVMAVKTMTGIFAPLGEF